MKKKQSKESLNSAGEPLESDGVDRLIFILDIIQSVGVIEFHGDRVLSLAGICTKIKQRQGNYHSPVGLGLPDGGIKCREK